MTEQPAASVPPESGEEKAPVLLQVRPRRIAIYASIAATLVVGAMIVVGLLLRDTNEGVEFRTSDQVGLIGILIVYAGLSCLFVYYAIDCLRPRWLKDSGPTVGAGGKRPRGPGCGWTATDCGCGTCWETSSPRGRWWSALPIRRGPIGPN